MRIRVAALGFVLSCLHIPAASARPTVEVREVESHVSDQRVDLPVLLRNAMVREIEQVDLSHARTSAILSATVVSFERGEHSTECTVSAAVRTKQGKLVAFLSGKATARDDARLALDGAVHGALAGLADALR